MREALPGRYGRRSIPEHGAIPYDEMVRLLGYVWDCSHDGTANVTGHRCATCRRTRAAEGTQHVAL